MQTNAKPSWPSASRTFWQRDDSLHFGTGAGITWGSESAQEWDETGLKAQRLLEVAAHDTSS